MGNDEVAETVYYWVAALTTLATAGCMIWFVYLTDPQKAAIAYRIRRVWALVNAARARRAAQTLLVWETWNLLEYDGDRDLEEFLAA